MTKEISLDQPLLEQTAVREILFPEKEGLIPNLILTRILKITRILVQNQLKQKFPSYELANLVVGYDVFTKDENGEIPEQTPQRFSLEWNNSSVTEGLDTQRSDDPNFNEFTSSLFSSLQQVINELLPRFIDNKTASICFSLTVTKNLIELLKPDNNNTDMMNSEVDFFGNSATKLTKILGLNTYDCDFCKGILEKIQNEQCTGEACPIS